VRVRDHRLNAANDILRVDRQVARSEAVGTMDYRGDEGEL
jgi:hypothetical protein